MDGIELAPVLSPLGNGALAANETFSKLVTTSPLELSGTKLSGNVPFERLKEIEPGAAMATVALGHATYTCPKTES